MVTRSTGVEVELRHNAIFAVRHARCLDRSHLLECDIPDVVEQALPRSEQDRDDVHFELVDQPRGQELLQEVGATPEASARSTDRGRPRTCSGP